jgi:hypothetical protein
MTIRVPAPVLLLALAGLAACGSQPAAPAAEPAAPATPEPAAPEPSATGPDTPVSSPAASSSAEEPAAEVPANCNFRAKGFCFATQDEACAAVDCPLAQCQALESHPARIKCAK